MSPLKNNSTDEPRKRSVLDLTHEEAKAFFLKHESYCNIGLPPYFQFDKILMDVYAVLENKDFNSLIKFPRQHGNVNHLILSNKDGRHAWRPLELIHPALYVSLVNSLTEENNWKTIRARFAEFSQNKNIMCLSLPVESLSHEEDKAEQVSHWWSEIEQKSIELALDYECIVHADITNCYGSIYTHSIAWAIHGKKEAKANRNNKDFLGNIVDGRIQDMRYGQTNGIPQGSVLMDFIAEMVLGYADSEFTKKIKKQGIKKYSILRYRDDYRIFANNTQDGEKILKSLTEVMIDLGFKLNASKTKTSNLVINESIKPDKFAWIRRKQGEEDIQKHLLIIHGHSMDFPNAGTVTKALFIDYKERLHESVNIYQPLPLISIASDIAYRNPKAIPVCSAILSKLLSFIEEDEEKKSVLKKIIEKFRQMPNTGYMEIWIQRISLGFLANMQPEEPLCKLAQNEEERIWDNKWISSLKLKKALDTKTIFDKQIADSLDPIVPPKEVELFSGYY